MIKGKNRFLVYAQDLDSSGNPTGAPYKLGSFRNVGGLSAEVETTEWKTGDMKSVVKLPGNTKWNPISLKRGFDETEIMKEWFNSVSSLECEEMSSLIYKTVYIYVLDRTCQIFKLIEVQKAWPSKYEPDELDSMSNDAWLENVELSHGGWKYLAVPDPSALPADAWSV